MRKTVLCILDFDDTLFPSASFLQQFSNLPFEYHEPTGKVMYMPEHHKPLSLEWQAYLQHLTVEIGVLLLQCAHFATYTVLVTNSSPGWIDGIIEHFLPQLAQFFVHVPQIHCRHKYPNCTYVKHHAVLDLIVKHEPDLIYGIGDQPDDYLAIRESIGTLPISMRFMKLPAYPESLAGFVINLRRCYQILHLVLNETTIHQEIYIELSPASFPVICR